MLNVIDLGVRAGRSVYRALPTRSALTEAAGNHLRTTIPGLAIAGAASFGGAALLAPVIAANAAAAPAFASAASSVPMVGPALGVLFAGGPYGHSATAMQYFTATNVLLTANGPTDRRVKWALAQAAQGIALSPLASMVASGAAASAVTPALLGLACCFALSTMLAEAANSRTVSTTHGVMALALSVAMGPLGIRAYEGAAAATLALHVGISCGLGAFAWTLTAWRNAFSTLQSADQAMIRACLCAEDKTARLNLGGTANPTVFLDHERDYRLVETVRSIEANWNRGRRFLHGPILLSGPGGTGKGRITLGIANHFNWPVFEVPQSAFDGDNPGYAVAQLFRQARAYRSSERTPIVVVFDEAESFYPDRAVQTEGGTTRGAARIAKTTAFNTAFEGLQAADNYNILFVALTNHPEKMDRAGLSRFSAGRIHVDLPTPDLARKIFAAKWLALHEGMAMLRQVAPYEPTAKDYEKFLQIVQQRGSTLSGRAIDAVVARTLHAANAHFSEQGRPLDQKAFLAFVSKRWPLEAEAQRAMLADNRSNTAGQLA